jgi:hypothetical protein
LPRIHLHNRQCLALHAALDGTKDKPHSRNINIC